MRKKKDRRKDPVEDRGLHLDESGVVKDEREGAEHHDDRKRYPQHGFGALSFQKYKRYLNEGGDDRDRGGRKHRRLLGVQGAAQHGLQPRGERVSVGLPQLEGGEKEDDGEEVEKKFHEFRRPKAASKFESCRHSTAICVTRVLKALRASCNRW